MKNLLFFLLLFPFTAFSQSIGIKLGANTYKPFDYPTHKLHPMAGLVFKYSPKKIGFGIEPTISKQSIYFEEITDKYGARLNTPSDKYTIEVPAYLFVKAIDKDLKLNIELGSSLYGKSVSANTGFYLGCQFNKMNIGLTYRLNKVLTNQFTNYYHSTFISTSYTF